MAYISCENDDRLWGYLDNFIADSQNRSWFFNFVQRNALSIQALIENDMFGELSDFDEENPAPAVLDQVRIVRAFLENAPFENYDINAITDPLRNLIDNVPEQARNLDSTLLTVQLDREEPWSTELHNASSYLNMLARYQILNQMERMLDSIGTNNADINELREWAEVRRQEMLNVTFASNQAYENLRYAFLGGSQLSQFVRNEINRLKNMVMNIWGAVLRIGHSPISIYALLFALGTAILSLINAGLTLLLPMRLLFTLSSEMVYLVRRELGSVGDFLPVGEMVAYFALLIGYIHYFDMFWEMAFGWQLFPATWTWGFIGTLVAGTFSAMYVTGLGLWALNAVGLITLPSVTELLTCFVSSPTNQPEARVEPAPNQTQQIVPSTTPLFLSLHQRIRLMMLLIKRQSSIRDDGRLEPEKKRKKQTKIEAELEVLGQTSTPYYLSNMDKKIIGAENPIPIEFKNFNLPRSTP